MGFSRPGYYSGLPCPPPGDFSTQGLNLHLLCLLLWAGGSFTISATWEGHLTRSQFNSVQSLSCVQLFVTPWTAAHQASLSITNSGIVLKLMCIELVMPSNHLILSSPSPSAFNFPSLRDSSNESALGIRLPKYWSFSLNISPFNEHSGLISFWIDWFDLLAKGLSRVFSRTTVQKQSSLALSLLYGPALTSSQVLRSLEHFM